MIAGRISAAAALFLFANLAGLGSANAADLGGDCCADLEERVAELEATTVRKGNKKVSVTLSGWVIKSVNWWDDGDLDHFIVGDKDYDLGSRFAITGTAQIAPGWSAGFNLTVLAPSTVFGFGANQLDDTAGTFGDISTLYSYMFIKSDDYGTLNWGHLSPASDNAAVLADISGTVIESNAVFFEGNFFRLRPKGTGVGGVPGLAAANWGAFFACQGLGANIGADCWGAAQPAVRYNSPTWGGFSFKTSYGNNAFTGGGIPAFGLTSSDFDFWDAAVFYAGQWGNWKVSAAYSYTWIETAVMNENAEGADLHQVGGTIMHTPTGLGVYGFYQHEETGGVFSRPPFVSIPFPETDAWYVKPFWRASLSPLGATVFFGEYGQYEDQFLPALTICAGVLDQPFNCHPTGSTVERWGLGVVQEIDAAAMHVYARWQHQTLDTDAFIRDDTGGRLNFSWEDWDLFQAGAIIFF